MAMATRSASCRSSERVKVRSLIRFRILSRASWNSLSSLACSGQLIARVEGEHIRHLLKTPRRKLTEGRRKSKYYCSLLFRCWLVIPSQPSSWPELPLMDRRRRTRAKPPENRRRDTEGNRKTRRNTGQWSDG